MPPPPQSAKAQPARAAWRFGSVTARAPATRPALPWRLPPGRNWPGQYPAVRPGPAPAPPEPSTGSTHDGPSGWPATRPGHHTRHAKFPGPTRPQPAATAPACHAHRPWPAQPRPARRPEESTATKPVPATRPQPPIHAAPLPMQLRSSPVKACAWHRPARWRAEGLNWGYCGFAFLNFQYFLKTK